MKKIIVYVAIIFLSGLLIVLNHQMTPKEITPTMVLLDENGKVILSLPEETNPPINAVLKAREIIKYSYIPHWSAIRTATSWYDRKIEHYYIPKDGGFAQKTCSLFEYNYPIISGELKIVEKNCATK
jgi:hypothetical protein